MSGKRMREKTGGKDKPKRKSNKIFFFFEMCGIQSRSASRSSSSSSP